MNGLNSKRSIALGGIAAALLMAGGQAYAITACPADAALTAIAGPGFTCQIADKVFSDFVLTTNLATHVLFTINPVTGDVVVTFSRDGAPTGYNATNTIDYRVDVASGASSLIVMHTLGVDTSTASPATTVTDTVTGNNSGVHAALVATNGATLVQTTLPGDNFQDVVLSLTQPAGAQLNSVTNDIAERMESVPEPASLSLFGLGLFGLGFARRRRS